jgi:hypothetical protein
MRDRKQPSRRARLRRIFVLAGLFVVAMGSSVNLYFVRVQAAFDEPGVNLYLMGGFWHVALGMDKLDDQGRFVGITVYAFGAAEHYRKKYVNPENYQGLERLLYYIRLLFSQQAGSIIEWNILKEPGMTLEKFLSSPDVRLIVRIHPEQAERIRRLLRHYISLLEPDPVLSKPWRRAWYGEALSYSLFGFNCATFVARLLFEGEVYTQANIVSGGFIPKDWRLPSSLIGNYLNSDVLRHPVKQLVPRVAR